MVQCCLWKCEFCSQLSSTGWSPNVSAMPQSAVNCVTKRQRESIPQCQWRQWSFNQMEKMQISADGSRPLFVNCSFMSMRNNMKTTSAWDLELPARLSHAPARFCPLKWPSRRYPTQRVPHHHPSSIIHHSSSIIHHPSSSSSSKSSFILRSFWLAATWGNKQWMCSFCPSDHGFLWIRDGVYIHRFLQQLRFFEFSFNVPFHKKLHNFRF